MRSVILFTFLVACLCSLSLSQAGEEAVQQISRDDERLTQRIKGEILRDLQKEDWLDKQIEQGIERYIERLKKQAEAERVAQKRQTNEKAKQVRPVSPAKDHIRGNPEAEISLIEYSDFECPFCKQFHATAKQIIEAYNGKVNWVYRHFPLAIHNPGAQQEAEAAECAAEMGGHEAFWAYADAIYARTASNGQGFPKDMMARVAGEMGFEEKGFQECVENGRYAARVESDAAEAGRIGVTGTPGIILLSHKTGDARLIAGAVPMSSLQVSVAELLDHSPDQQPEGVASKEDPVPQAAPQTP